MGLFDKKSKEGESKSPFKKNSVLVARAREEVEKRKVTPDMNGVESIPGHPILWGTSSFSNKQLNRVLYGCDANASDEDFEAFKEARRVANGIPTKPSNQGGIKIEYTNED